MSTNRVTTTSLILIVLMATLTTQAKVVKINTRERFLKEFSRKRGRVAEVRAAKRFFRTTEATISRERYAMLLKLYVDGTVHDQPMDPEIAEEAGKQLEEYIEEYLALKKKEKRGFSVDDLFEDMIAGEFHSWLDVAHPEDSDEQDDEL